MRFVALLTLLFIVAIGIETVSLPGDVAHSLARLSELHNRTSISLYEQAVRLKPHDVRVRWQAAMAAASLGNYEKSSEILRPLLEAQGLTPEMLQGVLNILVVNGEVSNALSTYSLHSMPSAVSPGSAAAILGSFQDNKLLLSKEDQYILASRLFELDPTRQDVEGALGFIKDASKVDQPEFSNQFQDSVRWRDPQSILSPNRVHQLTECDPSSIAESVGIQVEIKSVNLTTNGGGEVYDLVRDHPIGWTPYFANQGDIWDVGAFVVGVDSTTSYSGLRSLRFDGLLVNGVAGKDSARAGYRAAPIDLEPDSYYLVCFVYRDAFTSDTVLSIQLSEGMETSLGNQDYFLPPAEGNWRSVSMLVRTTAIGKTQIAPLLRVWKLGSVWVDDFTLYRVKVSNESVLSDYHVIVEEARLSQNSK